MAEGMPSLWPAEMERPMRHLYLAESCPNEPTLMLSVYYDQRAAALESGEAPHYPGHNPLQDRAHAARLRRERRDRPLTRLKGVQTWHMDGPFDATMVCPCGHWADFLCDTPIGKGRTCDRPMCYCCRDAVGDDLDRCAYHKALTTT